jgi:PIN domain nuclease of toxin-antitoxin system
MSILLDTHYVYALAANPGWLTEAERSFLESYPDRFVVSAVSIWEIRLKWSALHSSGERKGPLDPQQALRVLSGQAVRFMDLTPVHAATALIEPIPHRDPFDELLLVQAQVEGLRLLTRDRALLGHGLAMEPVTPA